MQAIWRPTAAQKLPGGLQEAILAPSGLDFGTSGSCCSSPPPLYLQPSGDLAIFGGRFLKLPGARFSRPRPLPLQPSGEHFRLLLARKRANAAARGRATENAGTRARAGPRVKDTRPQAHKASKTQRPGGLRGGPRIKKHSIQGLSPLSCEPSEARHGKHPRLTTHKT